MFPSDFPLLFTIFTEQHLSKDWLKTGIVLTFTSMRIVELFLEKSRKSWQIIVEIGKVVQLQVKFKYQNVAFYRISVEFVYISVVQLARTRSSSHVSVILVSLSVSLLPGLQAFISVSASAVSSFLRDFYIDQHQI